MFFATLCDKYQFLSSPFPGAFYYNFVAVSSFVQVKVCRPITKSVEKKVRVDQPNDYNATLGAGLIKAVPDKCESGQVKVKVLTIAIVSTFTFTGCTQKSLVNKYCKGIQKIQLKKGGT